MTFTNKADTWDQSVLNNDLGHTGMVELSETDLEAVSGGTFGLLYAKVSLVKSIFGLFGKHYGSYGYKDDKHDDYNHYNSGYNKKK